MVPLGRRQSPSMTIPALRIGWQPVDLEIEPVVLPFPSLPNPPAQFLLPNAMMRQLRRILSVANPSQ